MRTRLVSAVLIAVGFFGFPLGAAAGSLETLGLVGGPAPLAGYTYLKFEEIQVGDDPGRTVAVIAALTSSTVRPGRVTCVLTLSPAAPPTVIACTGTPVAPTETFQHLNHLYMNAAGRVVWEARVKGGRQGVYADDLTPVARAGDPIPGGGVLAEAAYPVVTTTKGTVFKAYINGVPSTLNEALVLCDGNCSGGGAVLQFLARRSDPVPDRSPRVLCDLRKFDASDFGVVFMADTRSTSCAAPEASKLGVFRTAYGGAALETLALEGEASDPPGSTFEEFEGYPTIGDDGFVAFRAESAGAMRRPRLLLCDPSACPATGPMAVVVTGSTDTDGRSLSGFSLPNLGDDGQFTFLANYPGGCGVFVRRPWGDIEAVALKGDTVNGGRAALECGTESWISYGGTVAFLAVSRPLSPGGKRSQGVFLVE
jgi:hypothetical protein